MKHGPGMIGPYTALMQEPDALTHKQIEELREAFVLFDHDGNGHISSGELMTVMRRLRQEVSETEITEMIRQVDIDVSGRTTYDQFVSVYLRLRQNDNVMESLSDVFTACDEDGDGLVSANDIYWTLCVLGYTITPPEVRRMVAEVTRDEEGKLTKKELCHVMQKKFTLSLTPRDLENLTPQQINDLYLGFHLIDRGKSGSINKEQARDVLFSLGHKFNTDLFDNAFCQGCISTDSQTVTYERFQELLGLCISLKAEEDEMLGMFKAFDIDSNGYIDAHELSITMKSLGMPLASDDVTNMMREIGAEDSGKIFYEDFVTLMSRRLKEAKQNIAGEAEEAQDFSSVQARAKAGRLRPDSAKTEELRLSFSIFDKNGDGHIERSEVLEVMASMGIRVDEREVAEMIHSADKDGNGMIEFDEFCDLMGRQQQLLPHELLGRQDSTKSRSSSTSGRQASLDGYLTPDWAGSSPDLLSEDQLREKFSMFDKDGDGFISATDLRHTMRQLGTPLTGKEIKAMMKVAGLNSHGRISFKGFAKMICGQFVNPEVVKQKKLTKSQTKELRVLFSLFDKNSDGFISLAEVESVFSTLRLPADREKLQAAFTLYDLDGNGQIDFNEFIQMMEKDVLGQAGPGDRRGRSASSAARHSELQAMFAAFDKDNSGYIDGTELKNTMKELGISLSAQDTKEMLKEAGGHGRIYFEDFLRIMTHDGGPESKKLALLDDQSSMLAPSTPDRSRASSGNSLSLPDYAPPDIMDLQVSFALFDKNKDGNISCEEVLEVMRSMGLKVNEEKVKRMIDKVDTDGNGLIDFEEFHQMMIMYHRQSGSRSRSVSATSTASSMSVEEEDMQQLFRIFDRDGDGFINAGDIRDSMRELGVVLTQDDVTAMMSQAGVGPNGKLYYRDFCKVMQGQFRTPPNQKGENLTQEQIKDLKTLFCLFDVNKDGFISLDEVVQASKMLGIDNKGPESVKNMFNQVDLDGNGLIDFHEFTHLVQNHVLAPRQPSPGPVSMDSDGGSPRPGTPAPQDAELMAMFRAFDEDGNGYIDAGELRKMMAKLGIQLHEDDVEEMLREANAEDGKIYYGDFVKFMSGEVGQKQKTASSLFSDLPPSPLLGRQDEWRTDGRATVTVQDLRTTFTLTDLDQDGLVGPQEVVEMLWAHDLTHVPGPTILAAVHNITGSGHGRVNFDQFCQLFRSFQHVESSPGKSRKSRPGKALKNHNSHNIAQHNGTKPKDGHHKDKAHGSSDQDVILSKPGLPHIIVSKCRDILPKIPGFSGKRDKSGTSIWPHKNKGSPKASPKNARKDKKDAHKSPKGKENLQGSNSSSKHNQHNGQPSIAQESRHTPTSSPSVSAQHRKQVNQSPDPRAPSPRSSPAAQRVAPQSPVAIQVELVTANEVQPVGASPTTGRRTGGSRPISNTCDTDNLQSQRSPATSPRVQADVRSKVRTSDSTDGSESRTTSTHELPAITLHVHRDSSGSTGSVDIPRSWQAFKMFDKNSNGYIDIKELDLAMREMGVVLTPQQLETMLENADLNGDGQIDYKEFKRLIHGALRRYENIAADLYERRHSSQSSASFELPQRRPSSHSQASVEMSDSRPSSSSQTSAGLSDNHTRDSSRERCVVSKPADVVVPKVTSSVASAVNGAAIGMQGNGMVDFNEYLGMMDRTRCTQNGTDRQRAQEQEMRQAFNVFDIDGNGVIDQRELRITMRNLGEDPTDKDINDMMTAADRNGDGKIDYEEFIRMFYNK